MIRSNLLIGALCALLVPTVGCNLVDVTDAENTSGRGAKAFDPYQSSNSGAIRLSLQMYNGCAVLPTGQVVPKNSALMPGYPDTCEPVYALDGLQLPPLEPGQLQLIAGTDYFLNQFTVTDMRVNLHTGYAQLPQVLKWLTSESRFKKLDWSNVGQVEDEWSFYEGVPGVSQDSWTNHIFFDNANWRKAKDDKFLIEIMNAEGGVRASVEYDRSELLASSSGASHSKFGWQVEKILPPAAPGDRTIRPLVPITGYPPELPTFRTIARLDVVGSTNPFKTVTIPSDLRGEGTVRVTWSQLPEDPFYFPVTYASPQDLPLSCFDEAGTAVQCGFGLQPNLRFVSPNPDNIFQPGDVLNAFVDLRDDQGNRLHPQDTLPSGAEMTNNQGNGLMTLVIPYSERMQEHDAIPVVTYLGPLHKLRTRSNPHVQEHYVGDEAPYNFISSTAGTSLSPGEYTAKWGTRFARRLPADAEAGTYMAIVKWNRYFAGERFSKAQPHFFQVGTAERTTYPARVGNCQICHRGVLSLDNLRHGLAVDHVEGCKGCHDYDNARAGHIQEFIHKVHVKSLRYPADRGDCTMCHLTRESATRPSLDVCSSCHPSVHGNEFFSSRFNTSGEPSKFGNCAQTCHGDTPPASHILPGN